MGGIYEASVNMVSRAMIYTSSFIEVGSGIQKLIGRIHTDRRGIVYAYFRKVGQK
jgi:hypothetical protein